MGCVGSKEDELPLVIRCRDRKALIKDAANHRYALAAAHVMYFRSLVGVGDALCQFIDEELLIPSPVPSPLLLPSDEGKGKKKSKSRSIDKDHQTSTDSSSSVSLHSDSGSHNHMSDEDHNHEHDHSHDHDHDGDGSHLHLSSGSDSDSEFGSLAGHAHSHDRRHPKSKGPSTSQTGQRQYGMHPEGQYGMHPGSQYGTNPGSQYGTNPGGQYGTNPGGQYGTNPGGQYGTNPGSQYGTNPGSQYGTNPGSQYGTNPGGQYGTNPGGQYGMNPGSQYGTNPGGQYGMNPGGQYGMNPGSQYGMNAEMSWEPSGMYPPAQTDWGSMHPPPQSDWNQYGVEPTYGTQSTSYTYYMKRSLPQVQSLIYDPTNSSSSLQVPESSTSYPSNPPPQSDQHSLEPTPGLQSISHGNYMKRSSPQVQSAIYDPSKSRASWQIPETSTSYINSYPTNSYENTGFYGYPSAHVVQNQQPKRPVEPPPPPSPKGSGWDFLNPFDGYDSGYHGYTYGSIASSPDSNEVREREGIPDLEDETESEVYRETYKKRTNPNEGKIKKRGDEVSSRNLPPRKPGGGSSTDPSQKYYSEMSPKLSSEGSLRGVPSHGFSEGTTKSIPSQNEGVSLREVPSDISEVAYSVDVKEVKSSPETVATTGREDGFMRKKGVTFEVEKTPIHDIEFSKLTGTRDLQEVVAEIRDEFATASDYGKEVAVLLEVGKLPDQPRFAFLRVILSRVLYMGASSSHPPSRQTVKLSYSTMKLAKAYYEDSEKSRDNSSGMKAGNLSSTLEKLYAWEKKLYKEVKDEEKLRVMYEKECKRLKVLDQRGAESSKIDATQASIRKLITKLNVCIRGVDAISRRIHKLRDEELQPQISELIYGLIRMWRSMLKCHQKQFQAIIESKARSMRMNANSRGGSSLKATLELEVELTSWYGHFSDWITSQKSFVESLNGWLRRCISYEPEDTVDGVIPYSPGRIGAPQTFVICNDWFQAMESISQKRVAKAMKNFALSLELLLENQGEDLRQRLKQEHFSKDFEKKLRNLHAERGKIQFSDSGSLVTSDSGVSPMDDLKVDLDSMKQKWAEEKERHREAVKLVHGTGSSSIQAGLVPIFEALSNFTSEAVKAYEHVRVQDAE